VVPVVAAVNKWYGDWLHRNAVEVQNALAGANSGEQLQITHIWSRGVCGYVFVLFSWLLEYYPFVGCIFFWFKV